MDQFKKAISPLYVADRVTSDKQKKISREEHLPRICSELFLHSVSAVSKILSSLDISSLISSSLVNTAVVRNEPFVVTHLILSHKNFTKKTKISPEKSR